MNAAAKAPAYRNSEDTTGIIFTEDLASVTRNGRVIVEFSGGTNPKDVVTHEQLAIAIQNYKVGDIYITTSRGEPFEKFGYGTWERFGKGKTLVGFSDSISNEVPEWVKTAGRDFGEYEHKLTVEELASHRHGGAVSIRSDVDADVGGRDATIHSTYTSSELAGGDQPHNNVQPSIVVYFWKRTE
jgi:hypothetical protein